LPLGPYITKPLVPAATAAFITASPIPNTTKGSFLFLQVQISAQVSSEIQEDLQYSASSISGRLLSTSSISKTLQSILPISILELLLS
jgi:hypothetical protein